MLTYGVDWILASSALNSVFGADRAGDESRPRPRRARSQTQQSWRDAAALLQPLDGRLHAADADPNGRAVFLQCHQQISRDTSGWTATPSGSSLPLDEYYSPLILNVLASQYWLVNVGTYGTILIELAFPFLIWQKSTRPYLLAAALVLHAQFAVLMGLYYFSFVMMMGHMSFVRPEWLTRLGLAWKRKMGDMEMIYDGRCGFCVRSMVWFLAFDGLGQIKVRDFRTNPSPVVSDAQMEKALYLVLPDGRALPGFEAYRYVVLRVPGLWWQVPFFYVPVFSRLIGDPIYNWVARNRSWLSSVLIRPCQS